MYESDRGAERAAWERFDPQRHPMQRDAGSAVVNVGADRESDENKQFSALRKPPYKPQIQPAAAEIVKNSMRFERLSVNVDAPHECRKGRLNTLRGPALIADVADLRLGVGASIGIRAPHRPSNYPRAHAQVWQYHTRFAVRTHRTKRHY